MALRSGTVKTSHYMKEARERLNTSITFVCKYSDVLKWKRDRKFEKDRRGKLSQSDLVRAKVTVFE